MSIHANMAGQPLQFPSVNGQGNAASRAGSRHGIYRGLHLVAKRPVLVRGPKTLVQAKAIAAQVEAEVAAKAGRDRDRVHFAQARRAVMPKLAPQRETPFRVLRRLWQTLLRGSA